MSGGISSALLKKLSGQYDEEVIQRLNLGGRGLTEIRNLYNCKALNELSLAQNELTSLNGLEVLSQLQRLDLSYNRLRNLDGLEGLPLCESITFLDLRGNLITEIGDVHCLIGCMKLRSLYFQGPEGEDANPLCSHASYPKVVLQSLPLLQVLDSSHVSLLQTVTQLQEQLDSVRPQDAVAGEEPQLESWLDSREMELLEGDQPLSNQSSLAKQRQVTAAENISKALGEECSHLLRRATAVVQKAQLGES